MRANEEFKKNTKWKKETVNGGGSKSDIKKKKH